MRNHGNDARTKSIKADQAALKMPYWICDSAVQQTSLDVFHVASMCGHCIQGPTTLGIRVSKRVIMQNHAVERRWPDVRRNKVIPNDILESAAAMLDTIDMAADPRAMVGQYSVGMSLSGFP